MNKKQKRNIVRKQWYIIAMVVLSLLYLLGQHFCNWERLTETVATIVAIFSFVAFWIEYYENHLLNEAQFMTTLNEQFIGNDKLTGVERELEKFYYKQQKDELTEEYTSKFKKKFDIDNEDRQSLINYLVHLEGIAALVKNKVLSIETIDDLMSYRYFIAMNNPVVQELELLEYPDFYKGCYFIYDDWVTDLVKQGIEVPMLKEYKLPKFDDVKRCQQERN